jgi:hypothetical protein
MAPITTTTEVDRPPEEVFSYVTLKIRERGDPCGKVIAEVSASA